MSQREAQLFGGAITCVFPDTVVDVSEFRQVPDTQEVYTEAETGMCIIFDLLARQHEVSDGECALFFFKDLAGANGCSEGDYTIGAQKTLTSSDYPHVSHLPSGALPESGQQCVHACVISGMQRISKYTNEQGKENDVLVALVVLRFPPRVSTDVLISISAPQRINPESSDAHVVKQLRSEEEVLEVLQRILSTFTVKDWALFVPEE